MKKKLGWWELITGQEQIESESLNINWQNGLNKSWEGRIKMAYRRADVEATALYAKRFVRYEEGAKKYSMGLSKFQTLAREAKATYKVDKLVLVNCDLFEKYLEKVHYLILKSRNLHSCSQSRLFYRLLRCKSAVRGGSVDVKINFAHVCFLFFLV